jgi:intergrase/recombinase
MFLDFINEYGTTILYAILTAVGGYLGIVVKNLYTKYINDKTKEKVAKTVVQAVEQIYKDLHGEEKLNKALESAAEMLEQKGVAVTELELRMLIEAAVGEFNEAFKKGE